MPNTRDKLVELLGSVSCNGNGESLGSCPDRKYGICGEMANLSYCVIQNTANHLISHGVTVQEWISVNDRLPEPMEWVLCACRAKIIEVLRYDNIMDDWDTTMPNRAYMKGFVTHWMPLPEPPKGE